MSYKVEFRKSIYNLVGRMPKSSIVNMFQGPHIFRTTNYRAVRKWKKKNIMSEFTEN